jgi:hypothetical protein
MTRRPLSLTCVVATLAALLGLGLTAGPGAAATAAAGPAQPAAAVVGAPTD